MNRRAMFAWMAGGAAGGLGWSVAFLRTIAIPTPSISLTGSGDAQLALVDSGSARALVVIGALHERHVSMVSQMLTLTRQRIDIVLASNDAARVIQASWGPQRHVRRYLVPGAAVAGERFTPVTGGELNLGALQLELRATFRGDWWARDETSAIWAVDVHGPQSVVTMTAEPAMLAAAECDLLVTPQMPLVRHIQEVGCGGIAANQPIEETWELAGLIALQTFRDDVGLVRFTEAGLALPGWARVLG